ncbi:MAG: FMN-binding protein [Planctomycetota bacterium]|nr:MAG: FMN-binding protein [Planctomycetota bacterium]
MLLASLLLAWASGNGGKVFLTTEEALKLAFPECTVERKTHYLTERQLEEARRLAQAPVASAVVPAYSASRDGKLVGMAYFDTHKLRTQAETLMVVVDPEGRVKRVEVLSFDEPLDYMPKGGWYAQFQGRTLDAELNLKRGIQGVTGASLTARATTEAVRRVLALHQTLHPRPQPEPQRP